MSDVPSLCKIYVSIVSQNVIAPSFFAHDRCRNNGVITWDVPRIRQMQLLRHVHGPVIIRWEIKLFKAIKIVVRYIGE